MEVTFIFNYTAHGTVEITLSENDIQKAKDLAKEAVKGLMIDGYNSTDYTVDTDPIITQE